MSQPPAPDAFRLLDWIMSRHVHEYLDVAGRPVGEGRSAAFKHVQTEMRSCPYAGSRHRHEKPMNASALRLIAPAWSDILTLLSWLSQRYRARNQTDIATGDDLSQVTGAGIFLADFLALRENHPLRTREFPLVISGLYKVCLGFQLAYMPERFSDDTTSTKLQEPSGFYAYLDHEKLLIGEHEVCSGSPEMIMQAYEAIKSHRSIELDALPPSCSVLEIAWERFDSFAHHASAIWRILVLYLIHEQDFFPVLTDPRLPIDLQSRLNALLKLRADQLRAHQSGLVADIARGMLEFGGPRTSAWQNDLTGQLPLTPAKPSSSLATTVMAWLKDAAKEDTEAHAPVIASALHARLAPYDRFEATVMTQLNEHVNCLMEELGLVRPTCALPDSVLSHVFAGTLRDWGDSSW